MSTVPIAALVGEDVQARDLVRGDEILIESHEVGPAVTSDREIVAVVEQSLPVSESWQAVDYVGAVPGTPDDRLHRTRGTALYERSSLVTVLRRASAARSAAA